MKKFAKIALPLTAVTTAAVGVSAYEFCNLVHGLLIDNTKKIPSALSKTVSGEDFSDLASLYKKNEQWLENYGYERHYIYSDRGEKLTGYLLKAKKPSKLFMFGSHGYKSNGRGEFKGIAQYYIKNGFNVFLCDHTSQGESEGRYAGFGGFESEDSIKWLHYLIETFGNDIKIAIHGVSMGAATVMMMSSHPNLPQNVKMIVEDCGYTTAMDEFSFKAKELKIPFSNLLLRTVNEINKKKAGYDFYSINPIECVKKAKVPMLFVHGTKDNFVPFFMAKELYDAYSGIYKDMFFVEGASHARSSVVAWQEYQDKLDEFTQKFIFSGENV